MSSPPEFATLSPVGKAEKRGSGSHHRTPEPAKKRKPNEGEVHTPTRQQGLIIPSTPCTPQTLASFNLEKSQANSILSRTHTITSLGHLLEFAAEWVAINGQPTNPAEYGLLLKAFEKIDPGKRTYSSLDGNDWGAMWEANNVKDVGPFHVADDIHEGIVIDPAFDTVVRLARTYTATSKETGCRSIIDCCILFALDCANSRYGIANRRVFHENPISHSFLPGIGGISGPTDYYISNILCGFTEETLTEAPDMVQPGLSAFVVLEAKWSQTMKTDGAKAQIFAQLLTLELDEEEQLNGHTGVLTDGDSWRFFFVQRASDANMLFSMKEFHAGYGDKDKLIIAILAHLSAGKKPDATGESPLVLPNWQPSSH